MLRLLPLIAILSACGPDETLTGYGSPDAVYVLRSMDDTPFAARATLLLVAPEQISGQAPCNSYTAPQRVPYPWFEAGPIAATRMACPDLAAEAAFLAALAEMQFAEVLGDTLILSNDGGREMVFQAE